MTRACGNRILAPIAEHKLSEYSNKVKCRKKKTIDSAISEAFDDGKEVVVFL
jgi:hypothetical protein